ncbi:relaxase/mobilization nuclease domain-containing protein [Streptomyces paromomycinus]|uniref:Mobilization protein n=1 Tax=Streptomyces paromomycinus TaxID=92743 RepID=A0A401W417_STREY|nr:mobilization protein [Streptomyces paromomycinus]GCD44078.1 mobilization protein [Streptomyces paromomycinus]
MIPSIHKRGSKTVGLLRYLYGPGTREEHIDPHLVAAFDPLAPDPGRAANATYKQLERLLDQPVDALPTNRRPKKHVWHLSVRASPEDPVLTDDDWAAIARRMVTATGIAPDGDEQACRWAAVRHATDHLHIVATLVRDDGRRPRLHNEARRAQAEARRIESDYGLRRVAPGDGTAAKQPTSAERHKAERQGCERTAREELRATVREAVAGVEHEAEFFARLQAAGLLVRQRVAPSGDLLGYKVALPGDLSQDREPIFYAGSTLAPDLSLPRLRKRFAPSRITEREQLAQWDTARSRRPVSAPAAARLSAAHAAWAVLLKFDQEGDGAAAARIAATGEILDNLAQTSAAHTRQQIRDAAWTFERAGRSHTREEYRHAQALRRAAREIRYSGPARGQGEDGATTAMLIDTLFFLTTAAAHWHTKRQHAQQAEAAYRAAVRLRAAYAAAAAEPIARLRHQGKHLAQPVRDWSASLLHVVMPELADAVLAEPGWPALAVTLTHAHQAGRDPRHLLAEAVAHREVGSADSISDVLVWRLRHLADLPADARPLPDHTRQTSGTVPSSILRDLPGARLGRGSGR